MKKIYIRPQLQVMDLVTENVLTQFSAYSGKTTDDVWTNKKDRGDGFYSNPIWGDNGDEE